VDQRNLPLDRNYSYPNTGSGVTAYILDTGIRTSHTQFGGRARFGFDAIGGGTNGQDCHGHGTHVAGTVGGKDYGVAKDAKLVAVRVLNCRGTASASQLIAGIDWVTANAVKPAVVNMSINGGVSTAEDTAIKKAIASGISVVVSSGNDTANACNNSPGRIAEAVVVNNSDSSDKRRSDSNFGSCTDLFAPGTSIQSAGKAGDTATTSLSGTSQAAPHAVGAAALYLSAHPTATPAEVQSALISASTPNKISGAGSGSPNRLLYIDKTWSDGGSSGGASTTGLAAGAATRARTTTSG
jgi:subtilisin family serine protease